MFRAAEAGELISAVGARSGAVGVWIGLWLEGSADNVLQHIY